MRGGHCTIAVHHLREPRGLTDDHRTRTKSTTLIFCMLSWLNANVLLLPITVLISEIPVGTEQYLKFGFLVGEPVCGAPPSQWSHFPFPGLYQCQQRK